jgi:hypothetical protein
VTPQQFVSPAGNVPGNSAIPSSFEEGEDSDGRRSELDFEREAQESFRILVSAEPWRPHRPRHAPSSYPGDFFLVQ